MGILEFVATIQTFYEHIGYMLPYRHFYLQFHKSVHCIYWVRGGGGGDVTFQTGKPSLHKKLCSVTQQYVRKKICIIQCTSLIYDQSIENNKLSYTRAKCYTLLSAMLDDDTAPQLCYN